MTRTHLILLGTLITATMIFAASGQASAQTCPSGAHCFYVPPLMPAPVGFETVAGWDLVLASPQGDIEGTYTFGDGAPTPFLVSSGSPLRVSLDAQRGVASGYATVEQRGIFVTASRADLSVVQRFMEGPWNSSATIKEASTSLGTRFRAGGYILSALSSAETGHDMVSLYAPFGATVTIEPPGDDQEFWGDGHVGHTRTVTLGVGETTILRTRVEGICGRDITGALITSDNPISVITGGRGWAALTSGAACNAFASSTCGDDGVDHLIPESGLGTVYVVDKYPGAEAEAVTVVATVDDTAVSVNGDVVATLAAGAFYRFRNDALALIEASRPVYMYQDAGLDTCEAGLSIIPPLALATDIELGVDFHVNGRGTASVVIPTSAVPTVLLNGDAPGAPIVDLVPTRPDLSRVRFNVPAGDNRVTAEADFQLGLVTAFGVRSTGLFAYYNPFRVPGCGDGILDEGEACDDGNLIAGDGCSPQCRIETGFPGCEQDGDCVAAAFCDEGICAGRCFADADCDDRNPCTINTCDTARGACTTEEIPAGQSCEGGFCDDSGDCVVCLPSDLPVDPGCSSAAPHCGTDGDGARACVECLTPAHCDSQSACIIDSCNGGVCEQRDVSCDDGNPCTVDSCDSAEGCQAAPASAGTPCEPEGVCDGATACVPCIDDSSSGIDSGCDAAAPFCVEGSCVACEQDGDCADENLCTIDTCEDNVCVHSPVPPEPTTCGVGACANEGVIVCVNGTFVTECDPGEPAAHDDDCDGIDDDCSGTADDGYTPRQVPCRACESAPLTACVEGQEVIPTCAPVADGTPCEGGLCAAEAECVEGACVVTEEVACEGGPCVEASCDPGTGACVETPALEGEPCDDGDLCTEGGICTEGACVGEPVTCDPPEACEEEGSCNPATGLCDYPFIEGCDPCDEDETPPELTCPQDIVAFECDGDNEAVGLGQPTVRDACSEVTITSDAPTQYPVGETTVTFTGTDAAGNTASCQSAVEVVDTTAPSLSCPERVELIGERSLCGALGAIEVTVVDTCDGEGVQVEGASEALYPPGETTVTVTATDAAGNEARCTTVVVVTGLEGLGEACDDPAAIDGLTATGGGCLGGGAPLHALWLLLGAFALARRRR